MGKKAFVESFVKAPFSFQGEAVSAQVGTALRNAADLLRTQRGEVFARDILEIGWDVKKYLGEIHHAGTAFMFSVWMFWLWD